MRTELTPGTAATVAASPPGANELVVRSLPPVVTQMSAVWRYSPKFASSPRSRSSRAPPIATLPYTASAAIPASATALVVVARSSETTTIKALERTRSPAQRRARASNANSAGIALSVVTARATPPAIVKPGSSRTTTVITATEAAPSTASCTVVRRAITSLPPSRSSSAASVGRLGRRSRAGDSEARTVASTPQPSATSTVPGRRISRLPTGKAVVR